MFFGWPGLDALFGLRPPAPAAAASVVVLGQTPLAPSQRLDQALTAVAPHMTAEDRAAWGAVLPAPLQRADIVTPARLAAFLGQCAMESAGFRALEENLNYSAARLCQVWPARFPDQATAEACAMQPERLANLVYAGRMGNGDAASGDGWRFRGRGLIQITGRETYQRFADAIGLDLDAAVAHVATRQGAADSAAWFWTTRGLNAFADAGMLEKITIAINGGSQGEAERLRLIGAARRMLGA